MKRPFLQRWFPRWLRWVLGILLFPVVAFFFGEWRAERAWQHYCTEARTRGVKLTLEEFRPKPPIPDAENFAAIPIFKEAFAMDGKGPVVSKITNFNHWPLPEPPKSSKRKPGPRLSKLADVRWGFVKNKTITDDPTEDDATAVLRGLQSLAPELQQIHEGALQRQKSIYPVEWEAGFGAHYPHLHVISPLSRILAKKVSAELTAHHSEQALSDFEDLFALSWSLEKENCIISSLVTLSAQAIISEKIWETLEDGEWSDAQLLELEEKLAACNPIERHRFAIESERAYFNCQIEICIRQRFKSDFGSHFGPMNWVFNAQVLSRGFWRANQLWMNQFWDEELTAWSGSKECWQSLPDRKFDPEMLKWWERQALVLVETSRSIYTSAGKRALYVHAQVRLAGLACALERCRRAQGVYPEQLSELVPAILEKLPHDPCNGQPFHYRKTDDGYLLYSVGYDLKDDGGSLGNETQPRDTAPDWRWWAPGQVERD